MGNACKGTKKGIKRPVKNVGNSKKRGSVNDSINSKNLDELFLAAAHKGNISEI